jgi:hypothetical protein
MLPSPTNSLTARFAIKTKDIRFCRGALVLCRGRTYLVRNASALAHVARAITHRRRKSRVPQRQ